MKKNILLEVLLLFGLPVLADTAVKYNGVQWNWTEDLIVGTYAKGEPYVVVGSSSFTLTSTTPAWDGGDNGIMVNPVPNSSQGWDTSPPNMSYSAAKNIATSLPYTGSVNQSLVKAISIVGESRSQRPHISNMSILTLVSSAPAANSFRPPYIGTDKTSEWTKSDLDYTALNNLSTASLVDVPTKRESKRLMNGDWVELDTTWKGREVRPNSDQPNYGRDISYRTERAALWLQLNNTDRVKETSLVNLVQYGIDINAFLDAGAEWKSNGGHNLGRRVAFMVTAKVLGDAGMLAHAAASENNFQEEQNTFYVAQSDIEATKLGVNSGTVVQYAQGDLGLAEWGFNHHTTPNQDNNYWSASYRKMNGSSYPGIALVHYVMGADTLMNDGAFFDYTQRFWDIEETNRANAMDRIHAFPASFWDAHRFAAPPNASTQIDAATLSPAGGS